MPRSRESTDPAALRRSIERALHRDEPPSDIVPMLERLYRLAAEGSEDRLFAERRLAEVFLETEPWRAALHVRKLLRGVPEDDAAWALMGLAQALLGHHRYAAKAYRQALAIDPGNPWYAHNLGHLLDVALGRPREGLRLLEAAHRSVPDALPITCSLAHARYRAGDLAGARRLLTPLLARGHARDPDVCALAAQIDVAEAMMAKPARRRSPRRSKSTRTPPAPC